MAFDALKSMWTRAMVPARWLAAVPPGRLSEPSTRTFIGPVAPSVDRHVWQATTWWRPSRNRA